MKVVFAFFAVVFGVTGSTALAAPAEDLITVDKSFSQMSVEKGSNAAFLAYLADDGRIFGTGNQPPIYGKAEAVERFRSSGNGDPKTNVLSWMPAYATESADGTLGYTDGRWIFEGRDSKGGKVHLTGHYVTVWTKDTSGTWKVKADMGTNDPQPAK